MQCKKKKNNEKKFLNTPVKIYSILLNLDQTI